MRSRILVLTGFLLSWSMPVAAEDVSLGRTFFQTNTPFEARLALPSDFVVVHRHGDPEVGQALRSWESEGYPAARMFFIGSDAGRNYTEGRWDGQPHLDEAETRQDDSIIECAGVRPYMVPTGGWKRFIREMTAHSIDQGARAILPEEPLAHTQAGYSEAFKRIWLERFHEDWQPPDSSPEAFWKASKLKSDLYYELVETALDETIKRESELGKKIPFILPIHSLLSHVVGNMVYPSGRSLELIDKGLDGFVGQVWTGPIAWSMSSAEGKRMTREDDFFESAYLLYSYFANLTYGLPVPCFMLADPVEDDLHYQWKDYREWYKKSLVALLLFPWVDHFELMPWPDRVFLPGQPTGGGTPGPETYRRTLLSVFAALQGISKTPGTDFDKSFNPTLGYLVNDTLGWQRGGPKPARMESLHGLTVPLLKRGIPIQIVPLERSGDRQFLNRFDLLVVSYEMMKPLSPSRNSALANWVKQGGILCYVGQSNDYDSVSAWWSEKGFDSPAAHLRSLLRSPETEETSLEGFPFPVEVWDHGKGKAVWISVPSTRFAESSEWTRQYLVLLTRLLQEKGIDLYQGRPFEVHRGSYVIARTTQATLLLTGWYVDLFDPDLQVLHNPTIDRHSCAFYQEIPDPTVLGRPGLLVSGPAPLSASQTARKACFRMRSPDGTPCTLRVGMGTEHLKSTLLRKEGTEIPLETLYDPESRSHLVVGEVGWGSGVIEMEW